MCGIVAIISPGSMVPEQTLVQMRDRLIHRGPDDGRIHILKIDSGCIALGHRRLSIQDPRDVAHQPMISRDGKKLVVFNGEIYNFWELRRELEGLGRSFISSGDTEVLLQAYEQWGESCVERFNGMFAFFIWDDTRRRAFVARDRFGEKPLYFTRTPSRLIAFASEVKALFAHPDIQCAPDFEQVDSVMRGQIIHARSASMFRNVERFLPAHCMSLDVEGKVVMYRRYWTPDYEDVDEGLSERRAVEEFGERLQRSVELRTRADVDGAACLSGGLDSSALVALLADSTGGDGRFRLRETISAVFPEDPTIDEGHFVNAVLARTGVSGRRITPKPAEILADLDRLHWHYEEVVPSTSMYLEWAVMRTARELGYKVMIDGQGADELLGGYQYYFAPYQQDEFLRGNWLRLLFSVWRQGARLKRASRQYVNPERRFSSKFALSFSELRQRGENPYVDPSKHPGYPGLPSPRARGAFRYTLASGLLYDSLPSQLHSADRNAMASSVESRFPFLDYELVDWCLRVPDRFLIKNGWQKYILRRAMRERLPKEVCWRPDKVGYQPPQDSWLRGGLREWIGDQLESSDLCDVEAFDREQIRGEFRRHRAGEADFSDSLWRWASLAQWFRLFSTGTWRRGDAAQADVSERTHDPAQTTAPALNVRSGS